MAQLPRNARFGRRHMKPHQKKISAHFNRYSRILNFASSIVTSNPTWTSQQVTLPDQPAPEARISHARIRSLPVRRQHKPHQLVAEETIITTRSTQTIPPTEAKDCLHMSEASLTLLEDDWPWKMDQTEVRMKCCWDIRDRAWHWQPSWSNAETIHSSGPENLMVLNCSCGISLRCGRAQE